MPSLPSFSETQERLSRLIQGSRDRQSRNLDQLRRNIAAAESPGEGTQPRPAQTGPQAFREEPGQSASRERQRLAQVRLTIPLPPLGTPDYGNSVLDRVAARYASMRNK